MVDRRRRSSPQEAASRVSHRAFLGAAIGAASLGERLQFTVVSGGNGAALQFPAGWVQNDPSFTVLHDFVELTHNEFGIFTNATMVDQFSIPAEVRTSASNETVSGTMKEGARQRIVDALAGEPGFERLVVADGLRVITNHYARVLHDNSEDSRAYGFAFDDVAEFASFHQEAAPTEFVVRLTPFGPRP